MGRFSSRPRAHRHGREYGSCVLKILAAIVGAAYVLSAAVVFLNIDTKYAPSFSEEAFDSLRPGLEKDAVLKLLGPPLAITLQDSAEIWHYSEQGEDKTANYYVRNVDFGPDSRVQSTFNELYLD